ncbi:MAG TPA: CdaR family protein [Bryobacteraceae bacterium]|nr:CdaR family protein [Bryobacteraceae bacterium]
MRILTDNIGWKLFALALATTLWFMLVGESEMAASIPAPVQYKNVPKDLEITPDTIEHFYLKVRGPANRLKPAGLASASIVLDLAGVSTAGEQTFTLQESDINLPPGVIVTRVVPSQIRLRFEKRVSKDIAVEPRLGSAPPVGYRIAGLSVMPNHLRITGPESRVSPLSSAQTDPIDISSTVGNAEFRTSVFAPDPQVSFESSPVVVSVHVMLEKIPSKE